MPPLVTLAMLLAWAPVEPDATPSTPVAEYQLTWRAPSDCPEAERIDARIAALTEGRADGVGTLLLDAEVLDTDGRYRLRLTSTLRGLSTTREVWASECATLGETVAIVAALSLDPALASLLTLPEPEPEPEPEPLVPSPQPADPRVEPEAAPTTNAKSETTSPRRPTSWTRTRLPPPTLLARIGVGVERGGLPRTTAAGRVSIGLQWPRARVLAVGTYFAPRLADGPGGSTALYQEGTAALVGCYVWRRAAWAVPVCGGLEAGGLRADSRDLPRPRSALGPWLGPLARIGAVRRFGRLGVWVDLEGAARIVGTRVVVDESTAFMSSVGSVRGLAGIEIGWP